MSNKNKLDKDWDDKVKKRAEEFIKYFKANGNNYYQMSIELDLTYQAVKRCIEQKVDSKMATWKQITVFADWYDQTLIDVKDYNTVSDVWLSESVIALNACKTEEEKKAVRIKYNNRENMFRWRFGE